MSAGVIYILYNPSFPEYIKIGFTTNLQHRLKQLNQSSAVPYAFRAHATYAVNQRLTDKELHKLIDTLNPDLRAIDRFDGKERVKEFYQMSKEDGYELLECIAKISGTMDRLKRVSPEGHEIIEEEQAEEARENARRKPFNFFECGIPAGSEIAYISNPAIKATVVDEHHIQYGDYTTSLSSLARQLKGCDYQLQGTLYFTYNGVVLDELRQQIESGRK